VGRQSRAKLREFELQQAPALMKPASFQAAARIDCKKARKMPLFTRKSLYICGGIPYYVVA
jgi:hypothetical protein